MTKSKKTIAFFLCLVLIVTMALGLTACGDKGDKTVLAKVGDVKITQGQVDSMLALLALMQGFQVETLGEEYKTYYSNSVLIYGYVQNEQIKSYLKEKGIDVMTDETKQRIDESLEQVYSQDATVKEFVAAGITKTTVRYWFESQEYGQALNEQMQQDDPVTDDEIKTYFEANSKDFTTPTAVSVSHILMSDPDHGETTRAAIQAVLDRALDGEDFAALAIEFSEDPGSATSGGIIGPVTSDSQYVEPFKEASLKLQAGEISGIVESDYGYHIIKADSREDGRPLTLEEATSDVEYALNSEHYQSLLEKIEVQFPVEYLITVDKNTGKPPVGDEGEEPLVLPDESAEEPNKEE